MVDSVEKDFAQEIQNFVLSLGGCPGWEVAVMAQTIKDV